MYSRESQNVGCYKRSVYELEAVESSRTCSILKNFFCFSQSAGSPTLNAASDTWSVRAPVIANGFSQNRTVSFALPSGAAALS